MAGKTTKRLRKPYSVVQTPGKNWVAYQTEIIMYRDSAGLWRWRFEAGNGRVIADSGESYTTHADCHEAIHWLRQNAATAAVVMVNPDGTRELHAETTKRAELPVGIPNRGLEDMPIRIPPVKIIKPTEGKVVKGIIDVTVQVAKPTEIVKVELMVDATLQGVVTVPKKDKFLFQLDTRELLTGSSYSLFAAAYSKTGERFTSPRVNIRVGN